MKRVLAAAMVLIILATVAISASAQDDWIYLADLNSEDPTANEQCWSFHPEVLGSWGGEYLEGAVTAFPGDEDPAGYCTLNVRGKVGEIELRVLDGIADDSFKVYLQTNRGLWKEIYEYTDAHTTETWKEHTVSFETPAWGTSFAFGVVIKIEPTNVGWWGFDTWGQLAVDYIGLRR